MLDGYTPWDNDSLTGPSYLSRVGRVYTLEQRQSDRSVLLQPCWTDLHPGKTAVWWVHLTSTLLDCFPSRDNGSLMGPSLVLFRQYDIYVSWSYLFIPCALRSPISPSSVLFALSCGVDRSCSLLGMERAPGTSTVAVLRFIDRSA